MQLQKFKLRDAVEILLDPNRPVFVKTWGARAIDGVDVLGPAPRHAKVQSRNWSSDSI